MSTGAIGALLGLTAALGISAIVAWSPLVRRPRLDDRLAPYVRDAPRPSRLLAQQATVTPFPTVERLLGPVLRDIAGALDRALGGTTSVASRLEQAGGRMSVHEFRVEQVFCAAAGLLAGLGLTALAAARSHGHRSPLAFLVLSLVLAATGLLLRDRALSAEVARREQRIMTEFPTVAELLALSVAAGESAVGALERVARLTHGELAHDLARALADARVGVPLVAALERMATRTSLPAVARFVDGMAIAVERGTPLADVLRAQAIDVREQGRWALLEAGGRKEIAMLVPVVFLVLPVTVVLALVPGFYNLTLSVA